MKSFNFSSFSLTSSKRNKGRICGLMSVLACCFVSSTFAADPTLLYMQLTGATFHPQSSGTYYNYGSGGCIYKSEGTERIFVHKVVLPHGATVKYLRLYAYDEAGDGADQKITALFTSYNAAGSYTEHVNVESSNGAGSFTNSLSPEFSYLVNQQNEAINIVVNMGNVNSSALKFCGVQIAYFAPSLLPGPLVFKHSFEDN